MNNRFHWPQTPDIPPWEAVDPQLVEYLTIPGSPPILLSGPPRIGFGYVAPALGTMKPGLAVEVRDEPSGQCYTVWLPESEARAIRDRLLEWWPLP